MKLILPFALILSAIFLLFQVQANVSEFSAKDEKKIEAQNEVWNILTLEWPPYTCSNCPGQGIAAVALRQKLLKKDIHVQFTFTSWATAIQKSQEKNFVGFYPAYQGEEPAGYKLSKSLFRSPLGFVNGKGKKHPWKQASDLKGLRIGGAKAYKYPQEFFDLSAAGVFKLELVVSDDTNLRKVAAGDLDLALFDLVNARYLLNSSKGFLNSRIEIDPRVYAQMDLYLAFNKHSLDLSAVLDKALAGKDLQAKISAELQKVGLSNN